MQCGQVSAWNAAIATPATTASPKRFRQSRRREKRKAVHQRAAEQCVRQPYRRQGVADWSAIVVGCEDQEAERSAGAQATVHKRAAGRVLRRSSTQNSTAAAPSDREIDDHLEPDRQGQCGGDTERQSAADPLGVGNRRYAERQQRELPAVMIDPLGHEHAVRRTSENQRDEGERISAPVDQPP